MKAKLDLLLHPVRLRIVQAFATPTGPRRLTTQRLAESLPDVPPATLYRHVDRLLKGGVLRVAAERQVRGAVERTYEVIPRSGAVGLQAFAEAGREDHLRSFTAFAASLIAQFGRYLDRPGFDLVADMAGYREVLLDVTDDEFGEVTAAINRALLPYLRRPPGEGRRRRLLATITMPLPDDV